MIKKIDLKRLFGLLYGVTSMSPTLAARLLRHLALAGLLKFGQLGLSAQALPPSAEPFRVERALKPALRSDSVPRSKVPLIEEQLAPKDAAGATFVFKRLVIEGNSAVPTESLASLWPHQSGDKVGVDEVFALANVMTKFYAEHGYALCFAVVPRQEIRDGVVRIAIVEGFVSDHEYVSGRPSGLAGKAVDGQMAAIRLSLPLRSEVLERNLLLMDDLPGWSAAAVLNPDPKVIGGSALQVRFTRQPWTTDVSWSNFLPLGLGRDLVSATANGTCLADDSDEFSVGLNASPDGTAYRSHTLTYGILAGNDGQRLGLNYSQSVSRPQDEVLLPLEYRGVSRSLRLTYSSPLRRDRTSTINLECFAGVQQSASTMSAGGAVDDSLPSVGVSLTFDHASADQATNLVRIGLEQGLGAFGARGNSRANGTVDFTAATLDIVRTAPLASLGGGLLSYSVAASGQASLAGPMHSPSESSYGGRQFGRFFDAGTMFGEHAAYGSCELRYGNSFAVGLSQPVNAQFYGFFDAGAVRQQGLLQPQEARSRYAASAGVGVRLGLPGGVSGLIELTRPVSMPAGFAGSASDRINGSFGVRF
jgi:hemolysin activation/secretion protein